MLPKSKRLTTEAFKEIIEKGRSIHSPFLILRVVLTNKNNRYGISVPKKVAKQAVLRNKIRRRIYTIIDKLSEKLKSGHDIVVIVKIGVEKLIFNDLQSELERAFVKSSLLK